MHEHSTAAAAAAMRHQCVFVVLLPLASNYHHYAHAMLRTIQEYKLGRVYSAKHHPPVSRLHTHPAVNQRTDLLRGHHSAANQAAALTHTHTRTRTKLKAAASQHQHPPQACNHSEHKSSSGSREGAPGAAADLTAYRHRPADRPWASSEPATSSPPAASFIVE